MFWSDSTLNSLVLQRQNELVGSSQHCNSVVTTSCGHTDEITMPEPSQTSFRSPKPKCKKKVTQILDPSLSVVDLNPDSELLLSETLWKTAN